MLAPHGVDASEDELLERYARHEAALEAGDYLPYREILAGSLRGLCEELGFTPVRRGRTRRLRGRSATGPRFTTRRPRCAASTTRFKLGVITNCDRDLFALSNRRLGVTFDWVVTAEDARAYKPSLTPFERAFETIDVPARPHPPRGPEPLPRPRPGKAARPDDASGSTAGTTGRASGLRPRRRRRPT